MTPSRRKILLAVIFLLAGAGIAVFLLKGRVDSLYDSGLKEYRQENFPAAIQALESARRINPHSVRVLVLLGWSYWRSGDSRSAEECFARAVSLDGTVEDAKLGLAYASLANRKVSVALPLLRELARAHPDDSERHLALAEAEVQAGDLLTAAGKLRAFLDRNPHDLAVRREFLRLYGYSEFRPDLPALFDSPPRPTQLQLSFRTQGNYFQVRGSRGWRTIFPVGVNVGPARPGEFPSTASRDFVTYFDWFREISLMNSNTVRVYTVLPPAFYQALRTFNETSPSPLWLIQEVWLDELAEDLYDPAVEEEFQREIANVIDLLHGRAVIQFRHGQNYGVYTADVSRYVLALAVGREIEPRLAFRTNRNHPDQTSYRGSYVSLPRGNPTEAWFARMCDFAIQYEVEKYNAQRPVTVVNWPPLDPLTHPTEATYAEEQEWRRKLGEIFDDKLPAVPNDMDIVSLDVVKFRREPAFQAGLFALYHIYQHWPDFMFKEPDYARARDELGPNRYLGYLQQLKAVHRNFPLLVGEYGLATSLAAAHIHPQGWHNGGLTERQQADLLVRFTRNILETGCAGAIVFEWQDEWFKHVHDYNTADFELPWERGPLWLNVLDPEQNFGVIGYEAARPVPRLRGEAEDWEGAQVLYSSEENRPSNGTPGALRSVSATSDYAYVYLRLDIEPGPVDWQTQQYWIALNTLPGGSGSRKLPEIGVRVETGANFLVQLTGPTTSRILIAENYNPNERVRFGSPSGETRLLRKRGMKVELQEEVPFQEFLIEANTPRYARDGRYFPALEYSRSPFPYGSADRTHPQFSSHALYYADPEKGLIELRIPWGLLLLMDPSNLEAFAGNDDDEYTTSPGEWLPKPRKTSGISVAVFGLHKATDAGAPLLVSALPRVEGGELTQSPALYRWQRWDTVDARPYFKLSYFALQKMFGEISRSPRFR